MTEYFSNDVNMTEFINNNINNKFLYDIIIIYYYNVKFNQSFLTI